MFLEFFGELKVQKNYIFFKIDVKYKASVCHFWFNKMIN